MVDLVFLDSEPVGLITQRPGRPAADRCKVWVQALIASGVRVILPEIIDYEVRLESIRVRSITGPRRIDLLKSLVEYVPITTPHMLRAAEFRALVRQQGRPTASPDALDGDCILAAQAVSAAPSRTVVVATSNVRHLARFPGLDARPWESIT